jgi:hypothetical protein
MTLRTQSQHWLLPSGIATEPETLRVACRMDVTYFSLLECSSSYALSLCKRNYNQSIVPCMGIQPSVPDSETSVRKELFLLECSQVEVTDVSEEHIATSSKSKSRNKPARRRQEPELGSSTFKMGTFSYETSVDFHRTTTRPYIPGDRTFRNHPCEYLKVVH